MSTKSNIYVKSYVRNVEKIPEKYKHNKFTSNCFLSTTTVSDGTELFNVAVGAPTARGFVLNHKQSVLNCGKSKGFRLVLVFVRCMKSEGLFRIFLINKVSPRKKVIVCKQWQYNKEFGIQKY